jgi:phosphoglycolate phosphatase-like HAD superfamily hydrolase
MINHERRSNMTLIAINVVLDPDAVTVERAQATTARLRESYPDGFALDANHAPHITILQRFVRTADLDEVAKAVAEVLRTEQSMKWESNATGYYALADKDLRLVGIVIEPTQDLRRLQQRIIDAVAPFAVEKGTGVAFAPRPDGGAISQPTVDYVNNFVGHRTGTNYNPHLTIGIGTRDFVDALKAEPFETFTFRAISVSIYQVGDYGVAQRKLYDLSNAADPLPSWNDGPAKQGILAFIAKVTKEGSPDFLPPAERIAVFDNDGTLWCEKPMYIQMDFLLRKLAAAAEADPALRTQQPWQAAWEQDYAWFGKVITNHYQGDDSALLVVMGGLLALSEGQDVEAVEAGARTFISNARHPTLGLAYRDCVYQPMIELLRYLEANAFSNIIVTGGGRDFTRGFAKDLYGVPRERVIGSTVAYRYVPDENGGAIVQRAELDVVNDGPDKAVQIWNFTGRRPILAAGNSNGDLEMLAFSGGSSLPALRLLVLHDDAQREFDYMAGAEKALDAAQTHDWTIVSMQHDWHTVFALENWAGFTKVYL